MKSKKAWETADGRTFFDKAEANKHEESLLIDEATENLTELFRKGVSEEVAAKVSAYIVRHAREFASAISPLITHTGRLARKQKASSGPFP